MYADNLMEEGTLFETNLEGLQRQKRNETSLQSHITYKYQVKVNKIK